MATIPTVETERFLLRGHRPADLDAYAAMWGDPVVTRFLGSLSMSREAAWSRLLRQVGMWQVLGFGFWAIEEKATGAFVGESGFYDLKRDLTPSLEGTLECGWGFVSALHGKGAATEVVAAVLRWADANRAGVPITCLINPDNAASRRVAAKHGFREFARTTYHGEPTLLLQRQLA